MSNKPIESFRERGVTASIFENEKKDGSGTYMTANVERSYQDADTGEYKNTNSYSENELVALATVALQARAKIREIQFKKKEKAD